MHSDERFVSVPAMDVCCSRCSNVLQVPVPRPAYCSDQMYAMTKAIENGWAMTDSRMVCPSCVPQAKVDYAKKLEREHGERN